MMPSHCTTKQAMDGFPRDGFSNQLDLFKVYFTDKFLRLNKLRGWINIDKTVFMSTKDFSRYES